MTLTELIRALEKTSKENSEVRENKVYCQIGNEIISIDEVIIVYKVDQHSFCFDIVPHNKLTDNDKTKPVSKVVLLG